MRCNHNGTPSALIRLTPHHGPPAEDGGFSGLRRSTGPCRALDAVRLGLTTFVMVDQTDAALAPMKPRPFETGRIPPVSALPARPIRSDRECSFANRPSSTFQDAGGSGAPFPRPRPPPPSRTPERRGQFGPGHSVNAAARGCIPSRAVLCILLLPVPARPSRGEGGHETNPRSARPGPFSARGQQGQLSNEGA